MRFCPHCHRVWTEANDYCPADGAALSPISEGDDPLVGLELDGRYRLRELLGTGGMGFVYDAEQLGLGRRVAVKMLYAERTRDPVSVARFRREARALAALDHPGIVRVLEYGEGDTGATPYIVMDKVRGQPLDFVLRGVGRLAPRHAVFITRALAEALHAAHAAGIIHRDLKPANIHLELDGDAFRARILDFGLALLARNTSDRSSGRLTRKGVIFGTPEYMAPEQIKGQEADARADIYALGIVLYELLTGEAPFTAREAAGTLALHLSSPVPELSLEGIPDDVTGWLNQLIASLLAKDRERRPADAMAVHAALLEIEHRLPEAEAAASILDKTEEFALTSSAHTVAYRHVSSGVDTSSKNDEPFAGIGRDGAADRALHSALSADRRRRRARLVLGGVVAGAAVLAGSMLLAERPEEESRLLAVHDRGVPVDTFKETTSATRGPLLVVEHPRGPTLEELSTGERIPGGAPQKLYEQARHELDRRLAERGLRSRELRTHAELGDLWASQEKAARENRFEDALMQVRALADVAADVPVEELLNARLHSIERRLGATGTTMQMASLKALSRTLRYATRTPERTARYVRRLDDLERSLPE